MRQRTSCLAFEYLREVECACGAGCAGGAGCLRSAVAVPASGAVRCACCAGCTGGAGCAGCPRSAGAVLVRGAGCAGGAGCADCPRSAGDVPQLNQAGLDPDMRGNPESGIKARRRAGKLSVAA